MKPPNRDMTTNDVVPLVTPSSIVRLQYDNKEVKLKIVKIGTYKSFTFHNK